MNESIKEIRDLNLEIESLKARKQAIKQRLAEHRSALKKSIETRTKYDSSNLKADREEFRSLENQIKEKVNKLKEAQERANKLKEINKGELLDMEARKDLESMEYRQAFMNYVTRGIKSDVLEFRVDQKTSTSTAASVIPTTVMNEIIKLSKVSGNILTKVRKMNVKGGVQIPVLSAIPTASWIDEDTPSDRQKLGTGKVTFSYYGLEVRISQSLLSEYVSIEAFEQEFATLAVDAMTNAKEIAIFNGDGSGKPTGIFKTSGVLESTLSANDLNSYKKVATALSKLSTSYRAGATLMMAQETWDTIEAMTDSQGQRVAHVNYGFGRVERSFLGYPVEVVEEDRIKGITAATADTDYIMALGNLNYYAINGNGDLGAYRYRDEDKNEDVTKALEFIDGKVLQPAAFLIVKKATAAAK